MPKNHLYRQAYSFIAYAWQHVLRARAYYRLNIKDAKPIAIYQMGKVGSASIYHAIKERYPAVYHVHTMNAAHIRQRQALLQQQGLTPHSHNYTYGTFLREHVIKHNRPIDFITIVREPISRNVSAFFETFELYMGHAAHQTTLSAAELTQAYLERFPHERPLTYFDIEYREVAGIDVYATPFPHEQGYQIIEQGNARLLILKIETGEEIRNRALREFLGWHDITMPRVNVGGQKDYAQAYKTFKDNLQLPAEYVENMLTSKYATHFYTDEERNALRQQWLA